MNIKLVTTIGAAIVALHGGAFAGGEGWTSDFNAAKKEAATSEKDLLIDFTGSDWCGWCIKLNDEVFKHDEFKTGVSDKFVLVEIDFPNDKSKLTEETLKQNKELGEKYAVQGYPTILLADSEGRPYAATGYQQGGAGKYVAHLNELRGNKSKRDVAFAAAGKAEGLAKAKALVSALDAMGLPDEMVASSYGDVADQIKAADPDDETGFTKKAAAKKRLADFKASLQELAGKHDMDGALALVEETIKRGGFESDETQQMMMTRAVILAQQTKLEDALKAVDEAIAFAPDSPMIPGIKGFRDRIGKGIKNASKETPAGDKAPAAEE